MMSRRKNHIVCTGHTRPLTELQYCSIHECNSSSKLSTRTFLVSACHDKNPMLRDAKTGDWIGTFSGHKGAVWSTKLDPFAFLAATASGDFSVKVWDAITGSELFHFAHKHIVKSVDFNPESKRLATGGHEGVLRIYELENSDDNPCEIIQLRDEAIIITKCVWLTNHIILVAASDGKIRIWNVDNMKLLETLEVDAYVRDVEFSFHKKILTVAAGDKVTFFSLWYKDELNKAKGSFLHSHKMPIHFREEGGASLHPSDTKFVVGGSDLWVRVFDFETGDELECHRGHHGPIRCLRYSPDGDTFATGSEDGTIRLWRTER